MLVLLSILVLLLHIYVLTWWLRPAETETHTSETLIEVSMISIASPKPKIASLPPPPAPPVLEKKIEPKKTTAKPVVKKTTPVEPTTQDYAPASKASEQQAVDQNSSAQAAQASESKVTSTATELPFTEAIYNASYLHNPPPEYPAIATARGWEGKVKVRVHVSAEGLSERVEIAVSSGREVFDEAALENVKKYRFVPAKRGETPVPSTVVVPIDFHL